MPHREEYPREILNLDLSRNYAQGIAISDKPLQRPLHEKKVQVIRKFFCLATCDLGADIYEAVSFLICFGNVDVYVSRKVCVNTLVADNVFFAIVAKDVSCEQTVVRGCFDRQNTITSKVEARFLLS